MAQYDSKEKTYSDFVELDPCKRFVQYPAAMTLIGNIKNKKILDVGCGSGNLTRLFAKKGARVVAYDISSGQINLAKKQEKKDMLGIEYFVSDPADIERLLEKKLEKNSQSFDKAISNLVLHYAEDENHLDKFFSSTFNLLKDKGILVAIFTNPDYKKMGQKRYNRCFKKTKTGMKADFLDNSGKTLMTIYFSDFTRGDYEKAARKSGFKNIKWTNIKVSKRGVGELGKEYWDDFENDCPYVGLICTKK